MIDLPVLKPEHYLKNPQWLYSSKRFTTLVHIPIAIVLQQQTFHNLGPPTSFDDSAQARSLVPAIMIHAFMGRLASLPSPSPSQAPATAFRRIALRPTPSSSLEAIIARAVQPGRLCGRSAQERSALSHFSMFDNQAAHSIFPLERANKQPIPCAGQRCKAFPEVATDPLLIRMGG